MIVIALLITVLEGCVTYQSRPLNATDLANALTTSDKKQLVQQATLLNHPRIPPVALNFSKPLTSKELAVIAVLISPELKALRAKEGVTKAQVFDAGLLPDPQFAYNFAHPLHPSQGIVNAFTAGLNWDIGALVTRQTKLNIVKAQAQQTHYDVAWQEWLLANQAELLATRIYFLQHQLHLAQHATETAKHILDVTQSNLQKHNTTIDDFGLRQAVYLDFLDQTITLNRALRKTVLQLNQLLGLSPAEQINLNVKPMSMLSNLKSDSLFAEAKANRLDLLALKAGYASQEAQFYQTILGQFPHFTMGINRARDNTAVQSIGTDINFDIPLFNRNRGAIAIAKATREQLYFEYISRLNQARSDIAILVADLGLISKEENILKKQLPQMQKTAQLMRQGVDKGNITLITYESVLTSLLTNQLRLLTLRQNITEQMIALQIATGKYLY
jgi:cobalt-zinc-cadmium efflux system outer membrane protein